MARNLKSVILGISFMIMIFFGLFPYHVVSQSSDSYWPSNTWETKTPESQNMDSTRLEEMYDYIYDNAINLQSLLIVRNGYIIEDVYLYNYTVVPNNTYVYDEDPYLQFIGNRHHMWSASKSVTSLLIGIAIENGYIDNVDQTFFEVFPDKWDVGYNETKKNITIEHLLTMTHGLDWNESYDAFEIWPMGGYNISYVLNKELVHEPGTYWEYSTGSTQLLSAIIQNKTEMKTAEFAKEYLFEPIGINDTEWFWLDSGEGISTGGFGIFMTPRAMARIGLLCLNMGNWNGTQVVPEEWIDVSTSVQWSGGLFDPFKRYGYLWWLSPDYYSAVGFLGQRINVIPEHDIVVVFTAEISDIGEGSVILPQDTIINTYIIGSVIPPKVKLLIPGYDLFLLLGIISVGVILIIRKKKASLQ
ncbi:MAG: Loki-CTERM sorting domain-containing protein [Promethearchaeota archaeon]